MSLKRKILYIVAFIFVNISLIFGYVLFREATMANDLKKEILNLAKMDMTTDRYKTPIKTRGEYAIVEETIKEYLDDSASLLQDCLSVTKDSRFTKALSVDNYVADGPNFVNTLDYFTRTQLKFNNNMDVLMNRLDDSTIREYIDHKVFHSYYEELYQELMGSSPMKEDFSLVEDYLIQTRTSINHKMDVSIQILNFLKDHPNDWKVENQEIQFTDTELYNQYNLLIQDLNTK